MTRKERRIPTQERALKRVADILDAAWDILNEEGDPGFSTTAIAKRAGVSVGSLYDYFPNRKHIAEALIERLDELTSSSVEDVLLTSANASFEMVVSRLAKAIYLGVKTNQAQHLLLRKIIEGKMPTTKPTETAIERLTEFFETNFAAVRLPMFTHKYTANLFMDVVTAAAKSTIAHADRLTEDQQVKYVEWIAARLLGTTPQSA